MKSKLFLTLALIMGVITTYFFNSYMQQFDDQAVSLENQIQVVVAKEAILKNQRITAAQIEMVSVPEAAVHPSTFKNIADVEGKFSLATIEPSEMILQHRVSHEKEEAQMISRKVQEGYRAVSIGANYVQTVSNLLEPEDYVDVVFSEQEQQTEKKVNTEMVLQKVKVLAVGQRLIESKEADPRVEYSSVTLELKPEQAVMLVNATERGNLHLIVHSRIKKEG
jgi:pilus assembly protein CpaB